mmetsp:Transcript_4301/g.7543  ORF Transcript_4301/g.7543 Transcript_4301/m.7543 type:complete len:99 (+) Transcript_4301:443-739(+)
MDLRPTWRGGRFVEELLSSKGLEDTCRAGDKNALCVSDDMLNCGGDCRVLTEPFTPDGEKDSLFGVRASRFAEDKFSPPYSSKRPAPNTSSSDNPSLR